MQSPSRLEQTLSKINEFTEQRDWNQFHSVKNLAASISIEAAELNETIQWTNPSVEEVLKDESLTESIGNEIADVVIYSLRLCSVLNLDIIDLIENKLNQIRRNILLINLGVHQKNTHNSRELGIIPEWS